MRRFRTRVVALAALAVALSLCQGAKFPGGGGGETGKRLIFTIKFGVDMHVSRFNSYYYFVLIDADNDPSGKNGPVPVISAPWGNGYAAGHYTHLVTAGTLSPSPDQCYLWRVFNPDQGLDQLVPEGATRVSNVSGRVMSFEINSADLGIDLSTAGAVIPLQINIIATDLVPVNSNNNQENKHWDSLGDGTNGQYTAYLNIDIAQDGIHNNAGGLEPPLNDVSPGTDGNKDPALDIVDFSITVRS